ncbi:hypothetical protein [Acidovorax sp. MR-S7]|uniref:hypothetical protein n=1 Tax=Acidovorax sp. MR-S7 TaxID=1268622 RepID=UPI000376366D|nr:hypothetical protein [Acidovorax sp. MR-S7]GAD20938.1 NTP pyrophosphohydrolases including oxidative damage repair enzymes [Acidovorax sp. MR-S7]
MTDKPDLPLSAIRAAVDDAEDEVMQALQRFRERTGLAIVDAEIETVTSWQGGDRRPEQVPVRVRLTPQSI